MTAAPGPQQPDEGGRFWCPCGHHWITGTTICAACPHGVCPAAPSAQPDVSLVPNRMTPSGEVDEDGLLIDEDGSPAQPDRVTGQGAAR